MLAGEQSQRIDAGAEAVEEDPFIGPLPRGLPHAQRELADHPEAALRADQQFAQSRTRRGRRQGRELDLAPGGREPHPEHHLGDRAVAGRGLAGRPGGGAATERDVLEGLREMAQRQSVSRELPLERRRPHAALDRDRRGLLIQPEHGPHRPHVERHDGAVLASQRATPPTTLVPPPNGTTAIDVRPHSSSTARSCSCPAG